MKKELTNLEVMNKLRQLGRDVNVQIDAMKNPRIRMPQRTLSNVYFDETDRLIKLGDKTQSRSFFNVGQAKRFMQTMLVSAQIEKLLKQNQPAISTRQLYYILKHSIPGTKENTVDEQDETDNCIEDVESLIDALREKLGLEATPDGVISGPLIYEDLRMDETINCAKMGSAGAAVPPNVEDHVVRFKSCSADYILVVEKFAVWNILNQAKYWNTNNCIVMTGKGQAGRSARRLITRLNKQFKIPVYVFADMDVYGYYIYSVYKQGSINLAFFSEKAGCPDAKYLGLMTKDIKKYDIPRSSWIKLADHDYKRLREVGNYDWFKSKEWQGELKALKDFGYKVESDALVTKKIDFTAKDYLPGKIENKDFLP